MSRKMRVWECPGQERDSESDARRSALEQPCEGAAKASRRYCSWAVFHELTPAPPSTQTYRWPSSYARLPGWSQSAPAAAACLIRFDSRQ
eukprot:scaffold2910_cov390-Prasinococcus_capsulatus_cf.AAC.34